MPAPDLATTEQIKTELAAKGIEVKPVNAAPTKEVNGIKQHAPQPQQFNQPAPQNIPPTPPPNPTQNTNTPAATPASPPDVDNMSDDEVNALIDKLRSKGKVPQAEKPVEQKSPEELTRELEVRDMKIMEYGIEKLKIPKEDLLKPSELKNIKDGDLVFSEFAADLKAKNQKISDETILKRYNKEYNINTDPENPDYDEDESAYGQEKIVSRAKFIREQASKPIEKAKEAYDKDNTMKREADKIHKNVDSYIQKNKTMAIKVGEYDPIDYTLTEPQQETLHNTLANIVWFANQNNAGQDIDLAVQAVREARNQNFDSIVTALVQRETDKAVAKALEPYGNPVPFNTASTTTGQTVEQKVLASIDKLPKY